MKSWATEASSHQGRGGNFFIMRVYRTMPIGWGEKGRQLLGAGDLGWLFCWIEQMPLIRHDYLPDCLRSAAALLGTEEAHRLLLG